MEGRTVRWFLIGFGIAIAAAAAGVVISAVRRVQPVDEEDTSTEAPQRELQPVS
jgi:hypothetical protein